MRGGLSCRTGFVRVDHGVDQPPAEASFQGCGRKGRVKWKTRYFFESDEMRKEDRGMVQFLIQILVRVP